MVPVYTLEVLSVAIKVFVCYLGDISRELLLYVREYGSFDLCCWCCNALKSPILQVADQTQVLDPTD